MMYDISAEFIRKILNNDAPQFLEELAQESYRLTRQYFGRTISLYAPLYLSNFCSSECTYCGFKSKNRIKRFKLTPEQMHQEMRYLANEGIENVLLLTGESYNVTPLPYLKEAVDVAKQYFPSIALEVHPMESAEYLELFEHGVDGITVYQETYDRKRYSEVHLSCHAYAADDKFGFILIIVNEFMFPFGLVKSFDDDIAIFKILIARFRRPFGIVDNDIQIRIDRTKPVRQDFGF